MVNMNLLELISTIENLSRKTKKELGLIAISLLIAPALSFLSMHITEGNIFLNNYFRYFKNNGLLGFLSIWLISYFLILIIIRILSGILILWHIFLNRILSQKINIENSKWIAQGGITRESNKLIVISSNSGCLLKGRRFRYFRMKFNLKIQNSSIGIVFHAKDLGNYLMLQITSCDNRINITPHVRFGGNWERIEVVNEIILERNPDNSIVTVMEVKKSVVTLYLNSIKGYSWLLPTNAERNIQNYQVRAESKIGFNEPFIPPIKFANSYGMVGFRAWNSEKATISGLEIGYL
jgi:hypothetical protein